MEKKNKKMDLGDYMKAEFGTDDNRNEPVIDFSLISREMESGHLVNESTIQIDSSRDEEEVINALWLGLVNTYLYFAMEKAGFTTKEEFLAFGMTRMGLLSEAVADFAESFDGNGKDNGEGEDE